MERKIRIISSFGKYGSREVELEIGKKYTIRPLNPRKIKNRDRHCELLDFVPVSEFHENDIVAKIRYLDNNRVGRSDLGDLIPM